MKLVEYIVARIPEPWLGRLLKNSELIKFLTVGAITLVTTTVLFFGLKWTVLQDNPVTANIIAILVSTIISYVLNKEWSFADRGGRPRHHESALFFGVAGVGVIINQIPLWSSRYILDLRTPDVSFFVENIADFVSGIIIGTLMATAFRWWAMKRFVFLDVNSKPEDRSKVEIRQK
ncbi:putative flippase GtrA [Rhodococcus sp. OK302]|nr:putative flippase GtrA [Rhodococcus sp. OK302]